MSKILLVDSDSTIPNLALMRISSYHKKIGDSVSFLRLGIPVYGDPKEKVVDCSGYDKVYISSIFNSTPQHIKIINQNNSIIDYGGTGYDIKKKLPQDVYKCKPDYSIYPDNDTFYGFISRGCFRNCYFCVVPQKEGDIHREIQTIVSLIDPDYDYKKIKFLDNNFFGLIDHKKFLEELVNLGIKCQFNQGLDIRLIDEENAELLSKLNYIGEYIFAFDSVKDQKLIEQKLDIVKKHIPTPWKLKFFLYCHPDMDIINDVYYRILWCKENKVLPYFMRDLSCWKSENARIYNDLSAWCNQPGLFKNMDYKTFCIKRRPKVPYPECLPKLMRGVC